MLTNFFFDADYKIVGPDGKEVDEKRRKNKITFEGQFDRAVAADLIKSAVAKDLKEGYRVVTVRISNIIRRRD